MTTLAQRNGSHASAKTAEVVEEQQLPKKAKDEVLRLKLISPFDDGEIKRKPQAVKGERALVVSYVDSRVVMDRLDDVFGIAGWRDEYEFLPDGAVICRLFARIDGEWIAKMDVGSPSDQPDEGDRRKAAVSDALKRAAVKWGIGRYLYNLKAEWVDYDPKTREIRKPAPVKQAAFRPKSFNGEIAKRLHALMIQLQWNKSDPKFLACVSDLLGREYKLGGAMTEAEMLRVESWLKERLGELLDEKWNAD